MGLSKNKKKNWRKCLPGIDDEFISAKQISETDGFALIAEVKATELKYSTVPRPKIKKLKNYVKNEIIDLWNPNAEQPVLSKRSQKILQNMSRYKRQAEIIHPGTSWFPAEKDHLELLDMLQQDQMIKMADEKKYSFNESDFVEKENLNKNEEEDETEIGDGDNEERVIRKAKTLTTKQRRQRLANLKAESQRQKQKSKQKNEAHGLRNIDKFCKEIKTTVKQQKQRHEAAQVLQKEKEEEKIFRDQIKMMPFQLPDELAPNLRSLKCEGDLLGELAKKVNAHKFKAEKPKKKKKLTKIVKKRGLV